MAGLLLAAGEGASRLRVSTPVEDVTWVIWLFLSVGGSRSHWLSKVSSLLLPLPVDGRRALRMLSNQEVGRLISARIDLSLSERATLGRRLDIMLVLG